MTATKRGRGRPRGTGIDDTARIDAAYRLMGQDGSISFTSALKRTGTRDPSAIRRCQGKRRTFTLAMREAHRWRGGDPSVTVVSPNEVKVNIASLDVDVK